MSALELAGSAVAFPLRLAAAGSRVTLAVDALADREDPMRLASLLSELTSPDRPLGRALAPGGALDRLLEEDGLLERLLTEDGFAEKPTADGGTLEQQVGRIPGGRRRSSNGTRA